MICGGKKQQNKIEKKTQGETESRGEIYFSFIPQIKNWISFKKNLLQ